MRDDESILIWLYTMFLVSHDMINAFWIIPNIIGYKTYKFRK